MNCVDCFTRQSVRACAKKAEQNTRRCYSYGLKQILLIEESTETATITHVPQSPQLSHGWFLMGHKCLVMRIIKTIFHKFLGLFHNRSNRWSAVSRSSTGNLQFPTLVESWSILDLFISQIWQTVCEVVTLFEGYLIGIQRIWSLVLPDGWHTSVGRKIRIVKTNYQYLKSCSAHLFFCTALQCIICYVVALNKPQWLLF